jgi:hypothetical protein
VAWHANVACELLSTWQDMLACHVTHHMYVNLVKINRVILLQKGLKLGVQNSKFV